MSSEGSVSIKGECWDARGSVSIKGECWDARGSMGTKEIMGMQEIP